MLKDKILKELDKLEGEQERAEADGNSDLALLEGWDKALKWVLKEIERNDK
jgi:hypothetical protein